MGAGGLNFDVLANSSIRLFPGSQNAIGLQLLNTTTSTLSMAALGSSSIDVLDSFNMTGLNVTGIDTVKTRNLAVWNRTNMGSDECNLVAGTCTIDNTKITAVTHVYCMAQLGAGTPGALYISGRNAGVNYTVTSTSATETSKVACQLIEPINP